MQILLKCRATYSLETGIRLVLWPLIFAIQGHHRELSIQVQKFALRFSYSGILGELPVEQKPAQSDSALVPWLAGKEQSSITLLPKMTTTIIRRIASSDVFFPLHFAISSTRKKSWNPHPTTINFRYYWQIVKKKQVCQCTVAWSPFREKVGM